MKNEAGRPRRNRVNIHCQVASGGLRTNERLSEKRASPTGSPETGKSLRWHMDDQPPETMGNSPRTPEQQKPRKGSVKVPWQKPPKRKPKLKTQSAPRSCPTYQEKQRGGLGCHADRQNTYWYEEIRAKCKHKWQPLSFIFETQMLDQDGRVLARQPDISNGRVYCVCMKCCSHTYLETGFVGYYINSPDLLERKAE